MRPLFLADLHCDTLYELHKQNKHMGDPALSVDFDPETYRHHLQTLAIWSDRTLSDDQAYAQCLRILNELAKEQARNQHISSWNGKPLAQQTKKISYIPAIEDARLLGNDLNRLSILYERGIRLLTFMWSGTSCIGGAHDTQEGLSDFGRLTVQACCRLGMIPDVSHASIASATEVLSICGTHPVVASHSNSASVFPHTRNLTDEFFCAICQNGGLVGINLYVEHLGVNRWKSPLAAVMAHIEHFLSLGGEASLCFGCDFDGAQTPDILQHPRDLLLLADEMSRLGYSNELIEAIFYQNAERFFVNHITPL